MITLKKWFSPSFEYLKVLLKWIVIAAVVGTIGGVIGSLFHICIDIATEHRTENWWIILFLPAGGLAITFMYQLFKKSGQISTNRVIKSVQDDENVPFIMVPLIFISTCITHLLGGSAGREGAAIQLGGSLGYNIGKFFKLKEGSMHIIVMAGICSVFSALFGTPLTATFFAMEVINVGIWHYASFIPCLLSSITAFGISSLFGLPGVRFTIASITLSPILVFRTIILAILCALVGILFCQTIKKCESVLDKAFPNPYLRTVFGSILIIVLTFGLGTFDYNGAGMDVISRAIGGEARYEAFILKILFTAITIAAGFKGGEIVPAFFIGSTFGCVAGQILGISPSLGAAIGFTALFCSVVNCPVASTILALEVFGSDSVLIMAIACGVSFMMSGYFSLYETQKFAFSKLTEDVID